MKNRSVDFVSHKQYDGRVNEELNENKQKKQLSSDELSCFCFLTIQITTK